MNRHRASTAFYIALQSIGAYLLIDRVGSWWAIAIAVLLLINSVGTLPQVITGMPYGSDAWAKKAAGISTRQCKECGKPVSMMGTLHCQILAGIEFRDQMIATYGVLCHDHAALLAVDLQERLGLSDDAVQEAMRLASMEMMDIHKRKFG